MPSTTGTSSNPKKAIRRRRHLLLSLFALAALALALGWIGLIGIGTKAGPGPNRPPQAAFTFSPEAPTTNDLVRFDASASRDPDGRITLYEWDFDGDGAFELQGDGPQAAHFFDAGGPQAVTLRVQDDGGAHATLTRTVTVAQAIVSSRRLLEAPIPPNKVLAGGRITVTVTLRLNRHVSGLGLDEDLPEGWRARITDDGGATLKRSALQWLWPQELEAGTELRVRYEVWVPETAEPGRYTIKGIVSSFAPRFKLPVESALEIEVL